MFCTCLFVVFDRRLQQYVCQKATKGEGSNNTEQGQGEEGGEKGREGREREGKGGKEGGKEGRRGEEGAKAGDERKNG